MDSNTARIVAFLEGIGIKVEAAPVPEQTFLPGMAIVNGELHYDPEQMFHPGDLLHEAGHIALMDPKERVRFSGDFDDGEGFEIGVLCWSYAAALASQTPLEVLFHKDGYKGESDWLIETFSNGSYLGLPLLQWKELTDQDGDWAFPKMRKWLAEW